MMLALASYIVQAKLYIVQAKLLLIDACYSWDQNGNIGALANQEHSQTLV